MPTGYTAPVQDGEITDFTDFAINCSRAFGAMILLRDSDQSLEATKRYIAEEKYAEDSSYYSDRAKAIQQELSDLSNMTDDEIMERQKEDQDKAQQRREEYIAQKVNSENRYRSMLAKVRAWVPPTEDHVKFKEFMIQQLEDSLEHDCGGDYLPEVPDILPPLEWLHGELARLHREQLRALEYQWEEQERNAGRRKWVQNLLESL